MTRRLPSPRVVIAGLAAMALAAGSIAALLADLYGVAAMHVAILTVTVPAMALLTGLALVPIPGLGEVRDRIRVGALGGLLGTVAYDLIRVPFVLGGLRAFAPIYSYGVMGLDADAASSATAVAGWTYHLSNGITFGIIYALVAARRSRWWAVGWGVALEAAAFVGPFTEQYNLTGKTAAIVLAFGAHVAYGYPLGMVVERYDRVADRLRRSRVPVVAVAIAVAVAGIVVAFHPWTSTDARELASELTDETGIATTVIDGRSFDPEWLRIDLGECVAVFNPGAESFDTVLGVVGPGSTTLCPDESGIHRVRLGTRPFSGGFILVED